MEGATIGLGMAGLGNWGPNLLRNFAALPGCAVRICCDSNPAALGRASRQYPGLATTNNFDALLAAPIGAVVIATPAPTHYKLAREALLAGKHVFVEKPITLEVTHAEELIRLAEEHRRVLMVGHLLEYHPAVERLQQMIHAGELGALRYIYSQRLNLGVVRRDENVMWSLAPHDISVLLMLLGGRPVEVSAHGVAYLQPGVEDVVFLTVRFDNDQLGHVHVSWLDPHKTRRFTVVGARKMAVFDDMTATEKLRIYDQGVVPEYTSYGEALTLRFGDVHIPRIDMREPLKLECQHFVDCAREGRQPRSDGHDGLRVLRVLAAGQRSLDQGGARVGIEF
jgi:predicted dehydrogenase